MDHKVSISFPYGKGMVKVWDLKLHMGICGSWKLCGYGTGLPVEFQWIFPCYNCLRRAAVAGCVIIDWSSEGVQGLGLANSVMLWIRVKVRVRV